jgi:hypothetical protein
VVGVVVRHDDTLDRLVGDLADGLDQGLAERDRAERVDDHDTLVGDDEAPRSS